MSQGLSLLFFLKLIFSKRAGALVRRIAILSLIGMCLSTAAFIVVLSVMNGMNVSLYDKIIALEPHIRIQSRSHQTAEAILSEHKLGFLNSLNQSKIFPFENQDVVVRTAEGQFRGAIAEGLSKDRLAHLLQEAGRIDKKQVDFDWELDLPGPEEVIIGIDLARTLNLFEGDQISLISPEALLLPIGESPKLENLRVKKVLTTNVADLDGEYVFYIRGKALEKLKQDPSRKQGLEVWLEDPYKAKQIKKQLQINADLLIESWMDRNSSLLFALLAEKSIIGTLLGIAGVMAASSILTVLALLVSQKKRDIAVLETLGMSKKQIISLFTGMGLILSGWGLGIGAVIGLLISLYIQFYPLKILPNIYYDSEIPARVDFTVVILALVIGYAIAYLGSLFPAKSVLNISPSQVLRR